MESVAQSESKSEALSNTTVLKTHTARNGQSAEQLVYLVGTAHVSRKSCVAVQNVISSVKPDAVFLELCQGRSEILKPPPADFFDKKPDFAAAVEAWRRGQATLFDALYSWMLARVGAEMESFPGEEFRVAFEEARRVGATVVLGDRPIHVTVKRMWAGLSFWEKCRLCWHIVVTGIDIPDKDEMLKLFEEWEETDAITQVIREFGEMFPSINLHLIDERNLYMIHTLRELSSRASTIVAVVGMGHIPGITANWEEDIDVAELASLPKKKPSYLWRYCLLISGCVAVGAVVYLRTNARRAM